MAIGSRASAQSKALSPPPTMTTSLSAYPSKEGTKNATSSPVHSAAAGSGRGVNLPMPAVMMTALATTVVPSSRPTRTGPSSPVESRSDGGAPEEVRRLAPSPPASTRPRDQVLALDHGEAADVEDVLLRVHRRDLAAQLGQRVHDRDGEPAETGVVDAEEPDRPCSDDEQVDLDVLGHRSSVLPAARRETETCSTLGERGRPCQQPSRPAVILCADGSGHRHRHVVDQPLPVLADHRHVDPVLHDVLPVAPLA